MEKECRGYVVIGTVLVGIALLGFAVIGTAAVVILNLTKSIHETKHLLDSPRIVFFEVDDALGSFLDASIIIPPFFFFVPLSV